MAKNYFVHLACPPCFIFQIVVQRRKDPGKKEERENRGAWLALLGMIVKFLVENRKGETTFRTYHDDEEDETRDIFRCAVVG